MQYQFDATTEEEEVEAVTEHTDDGQDILHIGDTEKPEGDHGQDRDAAEEEDHPWGTHLHVVHPDPLAKEGVLVSSLHQVEQGPNCKDDFQHESDLERILFVKL